MSKISCIILIYISFGVITFPSGVFGWLGSIREIAGVADDAADVFSGEVPFMALLIGSEDFKLDEVLDKIDDISNRITELTSTVNTKMDKVLTVLLNRIPLQGQLDNALDKFHNLIVRVDGLYASYRRYSKKLKKYNEETIDDFISSITSHKTGDLQNVLNRMHRLFIPSRSGYFQKGLLRTLANFRNASEGSELCNLNYSFQQHLFEIYKTVVVTEIRGFVMTVFAYMILTARKSVPYTGELEGAVLQLVFRSQDYMKELQSVMKNASREILLCGAEKHIRDKTYSEFTGLFSYIVVNEMQGNPSKECDGDCPSIWSERVWGEYEDYDYLPRIGCIGRMYGCGWIGGNVKICNQPDDSQKRYEWIDSSNRVYGRHTNCPSEREIFLSSVTYLYSCDVCICNCVQEHATTIAIRTFSLRPQLSDIEKNMVVTGVKFTAKDKMIHIQIQQGVLQKNGGIDKASEEWIPLEDFVYLSNVTDGGFLLKNGDDYETLIRGTDFTFISTQQKTVNLDDITVPYEYVITGVRLSHRVDGQPVGHVRLQVRATKFNYSSGVLDQAPESTKWFTAEDMSNPPARYLREREEYQYSGEADDPTKSPGNLPDSKVNQYIDFDSSSLFENVGNYTIPLFDLRPVMASPSIPLGGIGIYHKSSPGYGGFLGLKLLNTDLSEHVDPALSDEQIKNYKERMNSDKDKDDDDDDNDEDDDEDDDDDGDDK